MTQYAYDTEDNLTSITDANGHSTSFAYNPRGWVTHTTFPSSLAESYNYDAVGNLLSKTDRKGQTIQYVYDALYRMTQKSYPDSTAVEYVYDLVGKIQQGSDPTGVYGFAYDNMGRLIGTTTQDAFLPGQTYTNAYTYDAASNRTGLTAPDGSTNTYSYDTLNRLNGLANSWAGTFGFGYDALSRRTSLTRPNGVNTSYSYDSLSHLLSVLHQAGNTVLDGASYTYDAAGNRTSKGNYLNGLTSNYSYDPLYQLLQVTGGTSEGYSYDAVGNRLSSAGVASYNYNASNELTSNSSGSYSSDNNGNTLTDPSGKSYTWDFENQLVSAAVPSTGAVTFKYDPFGRRIQKSGPLGTTNYLYDGPNAIGEISNSGSVLARYTQGAGIDAPLSEQRSGTTGYFQQDALSSVTSLSNSTGALANAYSYDTFGRLTASSGTLVNPFQYTGRELDAETGIYFYRARYYDATSGRFIGDDPMSFSAGVNFYAYVGNAPTNLKDSRGLAPDWWNSLLNHLYPPIPPPPAENWPAPPAPFIPFGCGSQVNCNFTPDMSNALDCFRTCLGRQITVTGGRGPRKKPNSSHERGEGCDLGRNNNPNISPDDARSCWTECDPNGYGQEENNGPSTGGTHYHFQLNTVPGGQPGFAPGIQPYAP
jgi:RHS repeat-associated protein